jgi:hypothetical protein
MILFPYARDIMFYDGELSFTLQFFDSVKSTDVEIKMGLDEDLSNTIQSLMDQREEV